MLPERSPTIDASGNCDSSIQTPLRVVLVNQFYPPNGWGGTATYTHTIARAYLALSHEVTVLTSRQSGQPDGEIVEGVRVVRIPSISTPYRLRRIPVLGRYVRTLGHLVYGWSVARTLRDLRKRQRFDLVEVPEINAEGLIYSFFPGRAPLVVHCMCPHLLLKEGHTKGDPPFDYDLAWLLERLMIRRAAGVVAPSSFLARRMAEGCGIPRRRIAEIPHPAAMENHSCGSLPSQRGTVDGQVTILYSGRLDRTKGAFTLVRAIPHLVSRAKNVRVLLAGPGVPVDGEDSSIMLTRLLRESGCLTYVGLLGQQDKLSLQSLLRLADICVVPSQEVPEVYPYTAIEAMSAGCPVVASRIGGIPDLVVDGECGLLFEPGNERALAEALAELVLDPQRRWRMGDAARQRVETLCDPIEVAGTNIAYYRGVLSI